MHIDSINRYSGYSLVFQHQVLIAKDTGRTILGAEALLRVPGTQSPLDTIISAEETGEIHELGNWIIYQACLQAVHWTLIGRPIRVSVNVSGAQMNDLTFPKTLGQILEQTRMKPGLLALELSERTPYADSDVHLTVCDSIKEMGVGLILDNFGTHYSWLPNIRMLPLNTVKIARAFITSIASNPGDEALVKSTIDICHALNISVIATGVETIAQRDLLFRLGCRTQQGFLFGEPQLPANRA